MSNKKRVLSIEPHGDGYAIYSGRDNEHHGFRLCNVNDFDMNKENTLNLLRIALSAVEKLNEEWLVETLRDLRIDCYDFDNRNNISEFANLLKQRLQELS